MSEDEAVFEVLEMQRRIKASMISLDEIKRLTASFQEAAKAAGVATAALQQPRITPEQERSAINSIKRTILKRAS